jgi:hypothetical protein
MRFKIFVNHLKLFEGTSLLSGIRELISVVKNDDLVEIFSGTGVGIWHPVDAMSWWMHPSINEEWQAYKGHYGKS